MLISVIVPVYNVEAYLGECIDSLIHQTYETLEIILVDDGSTDVSGAICDDYARRDGRIKVIHQSNQGQAAARNAGIEVVQGAYISFIDSDDCIELDTYRSLIEQVQKYGLDVISFHMKSLKRGKIKEYSDNSGKITLLEGQDIIVDTLKNDGTCVCNKLYARHVIGDERFPAGRLFEDSATLYRFMNRAQRFGMYDQSYYIYRKRLGSTCATSFDYRKRYDYFLGYQEELEFANQHSLPCETEIISYGVKAALSCLTTIYAIPPTTDSERVRRELESWVREHKDVVLDSIVRGKYKLFLTHPRIHRFGAKLSALAKRWQGK